MHILNNLIFKYYISSYIHLPLLLLVSIGTTFSKNCISLIIPLIVQKDRAIVYFI